MLEENEKEKLSVYFTNVAEAQGLEVEEVIEIFNQCLEGIEIAPSMAGKKRRVILKRAKSAMTGVFDNKTQPGDPFIIIPFGPLGSPRDWNGAYFGSCEAEMSRGNIKGLMTEGKVMTMDVEGVAKPVSKIINHVNVDKYIDAKNDKVYDENDEGETRDKVGFWEVTEADLWKKGMPVVYRDARAASNGRTNWGVGKPLRHRWEMQIVGMGYPEDNKEDVRLVSMKAKYDQADAEDDKFLLKHLDMFKPYRINLNIVQNSTTPWRYTLDAQQVNFIAADVVGLEDIDSVIEDLFEYLQDEHYDAASTTKVGKSFDELPDFLDGFSQLEEYHTGLVDGASSEIFNGAVRCKDDGTAMKSPSQWDSMKWNKFAIMVCDVSSIKEPSRPGGSYTYFLSDSTVKFKKAAWSGDGIFEQPKIPGPCIMLIKTSRSPNRYDRASRTKIFDPENGDISLTIQTIASIEQSDDVEIGA